MIYVDTESLFPFSTDFSIATHRINEIAAQKPPKSPEMCYIPAALYYIEQLGKRYRGQERFWESLAILCRSTELSSRKRAQVKSLARRMSLSPELVAGFLRTLTAEQMLEEAAEAKRTYYEYHTIVHSYDDAEDAEKFLQFAQWQYASASESLEELLRVKRRMEAQVRGDREARLRSLDKLDVQYDTSGLENQAWFWQFIVNILREQVLQKSIESSSLG